MTTCWVSYTASFITIYANPLPRLGDLNVIAISKAESAGITTFSSVLRVDSIVGTAEPPPPPPPWAFNHFISSSCPSSLLFIIANDPSPNSFFQAAISCNAPSTLLDS